MEQKLEQDQEITINILHNQQSENKVDQYLNRKVQQMKYKEYLRQYINNGNKPDNLYSELVLKDQFLRSNGIYEKYLGQMMDKKQNVLQNYGKNVQLPTMFNKNEQFLTVLYGKVQVILIPFYNINEFDYFQDGQDYVSDLDILNSEQDTYNSMLGKQKVILNANDVLYIPYGWFYQIKNESKRQVYTLSYQYETYYMAKPMLLMILENYEYKDIDEYKKMYLKPENKQQADNYDNYLYKYEDRYSEEFEQIKEIFNAPDPIEFNKNYLMKNIPFICRGCLKDWPAMEKWDDKYLQDVIGHTQIKVEKRSKDRQKEFQELLQDKPEDRMTYRKFVQNYKKIENEDFIYYYPGQAMPEVLYRDFKKFDLFKLMNTESTNIWHGYGGPTSPAHYDNVENFYCQLDGYKDVILVPPTQRKFMTFWNTNKNHFLYENFFEPDYENYPNQKYIIGKMNVRVNPGDMLYIPQQWIHHIRSSKERSFAVNFWFYDHLLQHLAINALQLHYDAENEL